MDQDGGSGEKNETFRESVGIVLRIHLDLVGEILARHPSFN
jgi:hypothetical protein